MGIYPLWHLPSTSHTFGVSWVQAPIVITPPFWMGRAEMDSALAQHRHSPSHVLSFQARSWVLSAEQRHPDGRDGLGQAVNAWQKVRKVCVGGIVLWKRTGCSLIAEITASRDGSELRARRRSGGERWLRSAAAPLAAG